MPIHRIEIEGVRGVNRRITLNPGGESMLVWGDNGTGKSSIERALRWALMDEEVPPAVADAGDESSFRRNVGTESPDPRVAIRFAGDESIIVEPERREQGPAGDKLVAACQIGVPFLRRSELLDVLKSRPGERFKYLERFLALDRIDALVEDLKDGKKALEGRTTKLRGVLSDNLESFRPLLGEDAPPQIHSVGEIESLAMASAHALGVVEKDATWEAANTLIAKLGGSSSEELEKQHSRLSELLVAIKRERDAWAELAPAAVEQLEAERERLASLVGDADELELIRHACAHFKAKESTTCPVCGQPVDWAATHAELEGRLATLGDYAEADRALSTASRSWIRHLDSRLEVLGRVEEAVESFSAEAAATAPKGFDLLRFDPKSEGKRESALQLVGVAAAHSYLSSLCEAATEGVRSALDGVPHGEDLPRFRLVVSLFEKLDKRRPELLLAEMEILSNEKELEALGTISDALTKARQDVVQETLNAIGETVRDYYLKIHPVENDDEATGPPAVDVQRHGRGTAVIRGEFQGETVKDPMWVYSDGHLDTVGICIFLALRTYRAAEADDPKILVLDDIVLSIDLRHAQRLLDLLAADFKDHQIFLFTHNGLFAKWCGRRLPNLVKYHISRWSLDTGPCLADFADSREALLDAIDDATPRTLARLVDEFMDEWLAEARFEYSLAVRAKPGEQYTLTDIWLPFVSALRKLGKKLNHDLGGAVEIATKYRDELIDVRNLLGAHENEFAKEYPRGVIVDLAKAMLAMVDKLYCRECSSFVRPIPNVDDPSIAHCNKRDISYVRTKKSG